MSKHQYGSYDFVDVGPGFVAFRITTEPGFFTTYLGELKLIQPKTCKRYRTTFEWTPDFLEFLKDQGYADNVKLFPLLKGDGLVLKADQAIVFRLRFL